MENVLVIKINESPKSNELLMERARRAWKINPKRLDDIERIIVLYNLEVLEEYKMGSQLIYNLEGIEKGRVELSLEDFTGEKIFKGKKLNYKTSNPATIKNLNKLLDLVIE